MSNFSSADVAPSVIQEAFGDMDSPPLFMAPPRRPRLPSPPLAPPPAQNTQTEGTAGDVDELEEEVRAFNKMKNQGAYISQCWIVLKIGFAECIFSRINKYLKKNSKNTTSDLSSLQTFINSTSDLPSLPSASKVPSISRSIICQ